MDPHNLPGVERRKGSGNAWVETRRPPSRGVRAAFVVAIAVLVVVGTLSYRTLSATDESDRWVRQTHDVLDNLQSLLFSMKSLESSTLRFVATGDESYLDAHRAAQARQDQHLKAVRDLTADNAIQQSRLPEVTRLAGEKSALAGKVIELRRSQGMAAAAAAVEVGAGLRIMDQFERAVGVMRDDELRLRGARLTTAAQRSEQAKHVLVGGSLLGLLIAAAAVLSILHDTSERKRTERELGVAQDRLRHVVSSSSAVLYTLAVVDGTLVPGWVSDNIEQLTGYRSDEAGAGGWWRSHVHPEDIDRLLAQEATVLRTGRVEREYRLRAKDGGYRWLRDEQKLVKDQTGNPIEVIGSWSDVTVRKGAEQRVQDSAEEYRLLFDSNPHAMWVYDNATLAFLAVNDAAVQLYGFSREEFLGMTIEDIRPAEEIPSLLAAHAKITDSAGPLRATEVKHCRKDGTRFEVEGASNAIEFNGRRARLVLATDVTEKRGLEAQLVQAQKMEAVGRLAGGVAHDFNNLLGVITGYSELLLKHLGPQHPGSKRVEQILKAALRAAGLTRQLLAFSRKQVLEPRVLDLNEVVADVEAMLRRVIGEDIEFVTTRGAQLSQIRADPVQLEQVLMNLAVNARDAMPKGGKLVIETANSTLDDTWSRARAGSRDEQFVLLSVSDTGEGMSAETQSHIFEPFFTTKAEGKGTGLGLATVFGIVEQSRARIKVSSRLGTGTTIKIYFPVVQGAPAVAAPPPEAGTPPRGSETILLVEDADSLRVIVREVLEDAGYRVIDSADPEEALLRISALAAPIHLLLTDVVMPRMSGPDLSRAVRIARPEVKVLFMSGYTGDAMDLHGVLAEGTQFIQKPFTPAALATKVRAALDAV